MTGAVIWGYAGGGGGGAPSAKGMIHEIWMSKMRWDMKHMHQHQSIERPFQSHRFIDHS